jgi:multiple sugar transport system permease protein/putative aldouronate transport system permease protein
MDMPILKNEKRNKFRLSGVDLIYMVFIYVFLGLFTLSVLYPLIYVVSCSFSNPTALIAGKVVFFPVDFSLLGYQTVFKTKQVWIGYRNTIVYAVTGTIISVFLTVCAGFVLSRREFRLRKYVTWIYTIPMFISGGMIPNYLIIRNLGMMDTMWALILPGVIGTWNIIICRTFLQGTIPEELFEAAMMDGCSYIYFLFKIVFPLSNAVIAVLALNHITSMWNSYMGALLYITSPNKFPLQLILRNILVMNQVNINEMDPFAVRNFAQFQYLSELLKYALIVVSSLPLLVFYPFLQKYFIKGVLVGSIKG